jgi:hypothetical protein
MKNEFKRMQFLAGIIKENTLYEEQEPDFSALAQIYYIVGDELEKAQKEEPINEILGLTAAAFLLALPGIINGVFRIIKAIKAKAPSRFNLSKPGDNQSHIDYIIAFTDKMDDILDTPFRIMLTPFIKDPTRRDKIAKVIKGIALLIMSLGIDITKSPDIMSVGKELVGEKFQSLATSKTIADLIAKVKPIIQSFFT